jgi:hypothetical protein
MTGGVLPKSNFNTGNSGMLAIFLEMETGCSKEQPV